MYGTGGLIDSASVFVMVNPAPNLVPVPEGKLDGINYDNYDTATLSLFAPYKEFVYVIGDFNDWMVDEVYLMNKDSINADTTRYWFTIEGLSPGYEYAYQYLVDGELRIADPYADKLLDPWNDPWISEDSYQSADLVRSLPYGRAIRDVLYAQNADFSIIT